VRQHGDEPKSFAAVGAIRRADDPVDRAQSVADHNYEFRRYDGAYRNLDRVACEPNAGASARNFAEVCRKTRRNSEMISRVEELEETIIPAGEPRMAGQCKISAEGKVLGGLTLASLYVKAAKIVQLLLLLRILQITESTSYAELVGRGLTNSLPPPLP
jgi:hypothetical protein